ncbi:nuclear transcription factor Y subunit B-4-like [Miscanthus floridulus]|uniref:nuclear transcription factor Y subunit B-4-like n=1 Tax=Miscanthus floridulus TaxID=154761 RepID=UPI00345B3F5B
MAAARVSVCRKRRPTTERQRRAEGAGPPFLPINNIRSVMRSAVPENRKIAKDAKESVQECVSEFISFVTSEASHKCKEEGRKSINGDDIIWSLGTLGFVEYVEPLMLYLMKYREITKDSFPAIMKLPNLQELTLRPFCAYSMSCLMR